MSDYTGLLYKTQGNISPQGRPRVYFCCHEADFAKTFDSVTEEILKITAYAAFWYYDPADGIPDGDLFFSDLGLMQLFVIPVTTRFLEKDCRARTVEMQYALDHHIPVLPLMLEPGLERDFNRICGDFQLLDKSAGQLDPTEIPYQEKLARSLREVLIPDKLAGLVRGAFDTYIFLSYRKKDRIYAQEIMRQIHSNAYCQDIAIWYDEFLMPGENFNDSIAAAMDKSDLLALVVTPNLLENPNYIMTTEYPLFNESGKPVLPIQALATDYEKLSGLYKGIEVPLTPDKAIRLMPGLISNDTTRINKTLRNQTNNTYYSDFVAMHNFLIGLAFLYGIEVEVDKDHALNLILSSAEAGNLSACKKLVSMYVIGEGVAHSYESAIKWQKRLVDLQQDTFDANPTEKDLNYLINEIQTLIMLYLAVEDFASAEEISTSLQKCVYSSQALQSSSDLYHEALYYRNLGIIRRQQKKPEEAMSWYLKALEIHETLVRQSNTPPNLRNLASDYMDLGDVSQEQDLLDEAAAFYQKALTLRKVLAKQFGRIPNDWNPNISEKERNKNTGTAQDRRNLAVCYNRLGRLWKAQEKLDDAKDCYRHSWEIRDALARETGTIDDWKELYISCNYLRLICKAQGKAEEAETWKQKTRLAISKAKSAQ